MNIEQESYSDPTTRSDFLERLGSQGHTFRVLFDSLRDVFFFVKNTDSKMVFASTPLLERLGLVTEDEIVGSSDFDFFPDHVARGFILDDRKVIQSGTPIINRLESWYTSERILDWFVTNKHPVRGDDHDVIGVMGTVSSYEGHQRTLKSHAAIDAVVKKIRSAYRHELKVEELAEFAGISSRQLQRRFVSVFGIGVKDFITKTRLRAACSALVATDEPISQIAMKVGFCDQSAFTVQFRKHIGETPAAFRRENRKFEQR